MDLGLAGKRALVTGASKGIGLATARRLVAEGADVAICARGEAGLKEAANLLAESGATVHAGVVDAGDGEALRSFVQEAAERLEGLDIVVHNTSASVGRGAGQWFNSFKLDLMPLVHLVEAAQPSLCASGSGAVVAIGTTNALETAPPAAANSYGALKAAVIQYASALGHTLAPLGIRVNTVSPGPVWFPGGVWEQIKEGRPELYEGVVASIPLGSMATDDDIATAVAFLASPAAGHITGANLVVDGGLSKRVQF
jgi:NAD(P)-dependent dehydrogenase (short-subunit alcohol dehydrogenase family)